MRKFIHAGVDKNNRESKFLFCFFDMKINLHNVFILKRKCIYIDMKSNLYIVFILKCVSITNISTEHYMECVIR